MERKLNRFEQQIKDYILDGSECSIESFRFEQISPLKYLSKDEQLNKLNKIVNKFYEILNRSYPFVAYNFKINVFDEDNFFSKITPFSLCGREEKISTENLESNKDIEESKTEFVRAKYLEMALRERDLILNSKTEQLDLLNSIKTKRGIIMYDYLFETNKQNAYSLAEKHNLSEYDHDYIRYNFWPIIKVNNYDAETIKEKLNALKKEFIKENTIFDLEIFKRENTDFLIYELNQYIDVLKRGKVETWEKYGDEIFYIFKMEADTKDYTLLISDKNITQLEIYFKSVLSIITEYTKPEPLNLRNSTKTEHGIIENFEISESISQEDIRRGIRTHIQINYEISLKEFLQTNYLADEVFYINYIDKNQKERLQELENEVSFFDISEGEKVTDDIANQWYNETITRDHYWYYKEYQIFLKERLTELEKIKVIEKSKKTNINIFKEFEKFEIFNKNLKNEITALFNQSVSKNEALNTYYKDYLPKYLTRINEIISHTEQMQNEFNLYFPELESDLVKLNAITSKFKKSVLNDLEITLNTVMEIDFDRHLFEYLNITNKLEIDLKIEGKKISDFLGLFYKRMLHIKSNPKPQQTETHKPIKKVKPKKTLLEFIHNITDKEAFLLELKNLFPTEQGKSIKAIILKLVDVEILIYGTKEFKPLFEELQKYFNRDIGTYQSINDVKTVDKETTETINKKLNPLIIKHKCI